MVHTTTSGIIFVQNFEHLHSCSNFGKNNGMSLFSLIWSAILSLWLQLWVENYCQEEQLKSVMTA